jgi:hypothetical protein
MKTPVKSTNAVFQLNRGPTVTAYNPVEFVSPNNRVITQKDFVRAGQAVSLPRSRERGPVEASRSTARVASCRCGRHGSCFVVSPVWRKEWKCLFPVR